MKRREFITLLGSAAAASPLAARAQQTGKVWRVGYLSPAAGRNPVDEAFEEGLRQLGWAKDQNIKIEYRYSGGRQDAVARLVTEAVGLDLDVLITWGPPLSIAAKRATNDIPVIVRWGGGDVDQIRTFAKELVALQPDLIVAQGTPVTAALQRETRTIPIVFVVVTDPVGDGFVAGLSHPGGNITGFLTSESAITAKMFELLTEIAPGLRRVAMLFNPDTAPGGGTYYFRDFEAAARSTKVEPIAARARSDAEIEAIVASLGRESGGGLVVMPDYFMVNHVGPIILLAARNNVPAVYPWRFVVAKDGALLSYGPNLRDIVRRGAPYVDRILRGEKPADLPVQVPVKFEMAVNAKTAKALGLTVPPSILVRADEVIE
jgi:putative ABC transport system substrate-binding protein